MMSIRNEYLRSELEQSGAELQDEEEQGDPNIRAYLRDLLSTFVTGHDHQDFQTIDQLASEMNKLSG
jgi:hypothetical protein